MSRIQWKRLCWVWVALGIGLGGLSSVAFAQGEGKAMPVRGVSVELEFGLKDRQSTSWDGGVTLTEGEVVGAEVLPRRAGNVTGARWKLKTIPPQQPARKSDHDPKLPRLVRPVLTLTIAASLDAQATVETPKGTIRFTLRDLVAGGERTALQKQVRVRALPMSFRLTDGPDDEDWPAAIQLDDGTVWMVYTAYRHARPLDAEKIHMERDFESLRSKGHGDQIRLMRFDGQRWHAPLNVTDEQLDIWRPVLAADGDGRIWVCYSWNRDGNWDLYAQSIVAASGEVSRPVRLTDAPGADINAELVFDSTSNKMYVVWQGWRGSEFDILLAEMSPDGPGGILDERAVCDDDANQWWPAAVVDSKGHLFVAYDTYARGNYDVQLVVDAASASRRIVDVAATPLFEARPNLVVDRNDRVWIAFEQAGQSWGKDTGMRWRGATGEQLYWQRDLVLRCYDHGEVLQAKGEVPCEPIKRNYPDAQTRRMSCPRMTLDGDGRLWLVYRRHPNNSGGGEIWTSWVTYHTGDGWSEPTRLANTENLMDNRPALVSLANGALVIHSTDARTNGTRTAKQNDLFCTRLLAAQAANTPQITDLPPSPAPSPAVHPRETEDVQRIQSYRATVAGKEYRLLRGEFHRHTELTSHRDMDGTVEDMFRYALDAARMDWIGNGDHDNGYGVEYLWWLIQKRTDMYHHPPHFMPMYTYERSVTYPSGHRNAMFAERGIRPLPRIPGGRPTLYGTPEEGAPDIKSFYAYLKHFGGICASHTSGTNMGTDWRDNDPEVEPVVEIYQGLRHSYEHEGAPATATGPDDAIGGYQPAGFVWNALQKGYRLGFQSSSDHYSSHISYAIVWAEDSSREAIVDAFRRRHCYAANDNIILDVRCGDQMMGDVFSLSRKPTLEIKVIGTQPLSRVSIIRGVGSDAPRYVYDGKVTERELSLRWTDEDSPWGTTAYYYVRIEQEQPAGGYGALAWASPMWITLSKPPTEQ